MTEKNKIRGKKARASGQRFELKVRKDLEEKKWIVSKWMNNVERDWCKCNSHYPGIFFCENCKKYFEHGSQPNKAPLKLIPAKHKFRGPGIPMAIGTGLPDFIAFTTFGGTNIIHTEFGEIEGYHCVIGVECKSNGYLTKEEKEKAKWYLDNNIFSKFLIAKKGKKRGEIEYVEL